MNIHDLRVTADAVQIVFNESFSELVGNRDRLEDAVHALATTVPAGKKLSIWIDSQTGVIPLEALLPPRPAPSERPAPPWNDLAKANSDSLFPIDGALSGKRIVISPGHGWYWVESLGGWYTQRGETNGIIEDFNNWRNASHLLTALEHTGATVYSCRERDMNTNEIIVDNDTPASGYSDSGNWWTSEYSGYAGGSYRAVEVTSDAQSESIAQWKPDFPAEGFYAVYVNLKAGANRTTDALYRIRHAGGVSELRLNLQQNDLRWFYIGSYRFHEGNTHDEGVELSNLSSQDGVVIADAVKFGGGIDATMRSGAPSGKPRWQMAARYWVEYVGAPADAYNATLADDSADVTTRPKYANWQGADAYISLHTNAAGAGNVGYGTETYMYNGAATTGSQQLRDAVHDRVVQAIRAEWDPTWTDRGKKSANFGELRELASMPGCLIEVGFHDTTSDADLMKRPPFRATVARAITKATLEFFGVSNIYPLPVRNLRALPASPGELALLWESRTDPSWGADANPSGYRIFRFRLDGSEQKVIQTAENHYSFTDLVPGVTYVFRVAAFNSAGESLKSEPMVARLDGVNIPQIMIVNGFDRLDRSVQEEDNTKDYILRHAAAIEAAGDYYFVSATNEAVEAGQAQLGPYGMVDWIAGEEARIDGERAVYQALSLNETIALTVNTSEGLNLFISGSDIAWDAVESIGANEAYTAFVSEVLKAEYIADDANTYRWTGTADGIFSDLAGTFDDGTSGSYDVDFADVIQPASGGESCMQYEGSGSTMGVCFAGAYRLVFMGVPFETIVGDGARNAVMAAVLDFLSEEGEPPIDGDEDTDAPIDGDWELDIDFEAPPDGDVEFIEADTNEPATDGDVSDGDVSDGDTVDGDDVIPDGDSDPDMIPVCPAGTALEGDMCKVLDDGDDGGCDSTSPPSYIVYLLVLLALFRNLRRNNIKHS